MPAKTKMPEEVHEDFEEFKEDNNFEEFKEDNANGFGSMTFVVTEKKKEEEPTVDVYLPPLPGGGDGVKVDQYEHVTIANEGKEVCYKVLRGEKVAVPISVFLVLKEKYPKL